MQRSFLSFLILLCISAVSLSCGTFNSRKPELSHHTITVGDVVRSYYLHEPTEYDRHRKPSLLFVLHGGGRGDGASIARHLGFDAMADRDGAIVVYPNGFESRWNDGRGETYRGDIDSDVDDVGFISALIDHMIIRYGANPARVYVTGVSNGGMMTFRLVCEIASKITAVAPIIANMPENIIAGCQPAARLPVLIMNGTSDPLVPYDGGDVHFFNKTMGKVVSTDSSVAFWVAHNRCDPEPEAVTLPDTVADDDSVVSISKYSDAQHDCDVQLYKIEGGGHTVPGSDIPDMPRILGNKNMDIDGVEVVWSFFMDQKN